MRTRHFVLLLLVSLLGGAGCTAGSTRPSGKPWHDPMMSKGEPTLGSSSAPVYIYEFADFRCGYCARFQPTRRRLMSLYPGKIFWIFKDTPFQPGSLGMHVTANCVHRQKPDLYWAFAEELFRHRNPRLVAQGARRLDLNRKAFVACLRDPEVVREIKRDLWEGKQLRVSGTPSFYVNSRMIAGYQPLGVYRTAIEAEIRSSASR